MLTRMLTLVAVTLGLTAGQGAAQPAGPVQSVSLQASVQNQDGHLAYAYVLRMSDPTSAAVSQIKISLSTACGTADFACLTVGSPADWSGDLKPGLGALWDGTRAALFVRPGGNRDGFRLTGNSIVGICPYVLDVKTIGIQLPVLERDLPAYFAALPNKIQSSSVAGTTVCPAASPKEFEPRSFLKRLIDDKEQAIQTGWIENRGLGISLDAKLNAANAALARGDSRAAVNQLNALLDEVNAQAGKQLSSEAAALLKFNTQYLIGKIR
jgi:FIMAH domain-containing protein